MSERTLVHCFDRFVIECGRMCVYKSGRELPLGGQAFHLLRELVSAAPSLLTHDEILGLVWPNRVLNEEIIKQNISKIRKALGDDGKQPRYVGSVRGHGYRIIPPVQSRPAAPLKFALLAKLRFVALLAIAAIFGGLATYYALGDDRWTAQSKWMQPSKGMNGHDGLSNVAIATEHFLAGQINYLRYNTRDIEAAIVSFRRAI